VKYGLTDRGSSRSKAERSLVAQPAGAANVHTGSTDVHTGAADVHSGASGVHTGAADVHSGASGVHAGASGVHTGGSSVHIHTVAPALERQQHAPQVAAVVRNKLS